VRSHVSIYLESFRNAFLTSVEQGNYFCEKLEVSAFNFPMFSLPPLVLSWLLIRFSEALFWTLFCVCSRILEETSRWLQVVSVEVTLGFRVWGIPYTYFIQTLFDYLWQGLFPNTSLSIVTTELFSSETCEFEVFPKSTNFLWSLFFHRCSSLPGERYSAVLIVN